MIKRSEKRDLERDIERVRERKKNEMESERSAQFGLGGESSTDYQIGEGLG